MLVVPVQRHHQGKGLSETFSLPKQLVVCVTQLFLSFLQKTVTERGNSEKSEIK